MWLILDFPQKKRCSARLPVSPWKQQACASALLTSIFPGFDCGSYWTSRKKKCSARLPVFPWKQQACASALLTSIYPGFDCGSYWISRKNVFSSASRFPMEATMGRWEKVFSSASRFLMEATKGRWVLPNQTWNSTSKKGVAAHLQHAEAKHEHVAYLV